MSETRKMTAILAAYFAGFSRLTATDEQRTIARLRGAEPILLTPRSQSTMAASSNVPATVFLIEGLSRSPSSGCSVSDAFR
jgi:hypothetical protein